MQNIIIFHKTNNQQMEINPNNHVVKLIVQGKDMETKSKPEDASRLFLQAWKEATNDFEKYTAAFYVARHQISIADTLKWLEETLRLALKINDDSVKEAFSPLYSSIAKCYTDLRDVDNAKKYNALAISFKEKVSVSGPFYHGTKADLQIGDLLIAGGRSNYKTEIVMNHIYFTALINGAGLAAALAKGEGHERVYIVEPTGSFEADPNVTNKKIPGNP